MATETVNIIVRESGSQQAAAAIRNVGTNAQTTSKDVTELSTVMEQFRGVLVAVGLSMGVSQYVTLVDTYTELINKMKQVSGSQEELVASYNALKASANETGQDLAGTIELYAGLSKATRSAGIESQDLLEVVRVMNFALDASGRSTEEVRGAMTQLAVAFRNDEVSGRGFITLLRQFPELTDAMARSMGMSSQAFRQFAEDGNLSTEKFVEAVKKAGDEVRRLSQTTDDTISEAFVRLKNNVLDYFGQMDQASGASHMLSAAITAVANNLNVILPLVGAFTAFLTTVGIVAGSSALALGLMASPIAVLAGALVAVTTLVLSFGQSWKVTADGSITVAGALIGVIQTVISYFVSFGKALVDLVGPSNAAWIGIGALAAALIALTGIKVVGFLTTLVQGIIGLGSALLALAANPITLVIAGLTTLALTVAYLTGNLDPLIAKLKQLAGEVTAAMKSASTDSTKTGLEIRKMADDIIKSYGDVGNAGKKLSADTKKSTDEIRGYWRHAMNDPDAGIKAYAQLAEESARKAAAAMQVLYREQGLNSQGLQDMASEGYSAAGSMDALAQSTQGATYSATIGSMKIWGTKEYIEAHADSLGGASIQWDHLADSAESSADRVAKAAQKAQQAWGPMGSGTPGATGASGTFQTVSGFESPELADAARAMLVAQERDKWYGTNTFAAAEARFKALQRTLYVDKLFPIWEKNLSYQSAPGAFNAFANGGSFTVGGHGPTDSQLVQFMATPGERVTVTRPDDEVRMQRRQERAATQRPVVVNMTVVTPDAGSFKRNEKQITTSLLGRLTKVQREL